MILEGFEKIESQDFVRFSEESQQFLLKISKDRERLCKLLKKASSNELLVGLSRRYGAVDKFVLAERSDGRLQLRMHIYANHKELEEGEVDIEMIHNHRWNFSSLILLGGYRHVLYGDSLSPVCIRDEKEGSIYSLHHSQYHSVAGEAGSITLIIRGPHEKEKFQVVGSERAKEGVLGISHSSMQKGSREALFEKVVKVLYSR